MRLGAKMTMPTIPTTPMRPAMPKSLAFAPPTNITTARISSRISAVPRSRPSSTSPTTSSPKGASSGTTACFHWSISLALRSTTQAPHSARATLANSEGWMENGPMKIQFLLP
ncbi:hypothetical protein D9M71_823600 [compost metagenome]